MAQVLVRGDCLKVGFLPANPDPAIFIASQGVQSFDEPQLVPVKLGLKNIKAITRITYTRDEPADYWARRGYSRYDGI